MSKIPTYPKYLNPQHTMKALNFSLSFLHNVCLVKVRILIKKARVLIKLQFLGGKKQLTLLVHRKKMVLTYQLHSQHTDEEKTPMNSTPLSHWVPLHFFLIPSPDIQCVKWSNCKSTMADPHQVSLHISAPLTDLAWRSGLQNDLIPVPLCSSSNELSAVVAISHVHDGQSIGFYYTLIYHKSWMREGGGLSIQKPCSHNV